MLGLTLLWAWTAVWSDGARPYPDVPSHHWVVLGLARAKRDGLMVGSSDGLGYPKVKTASEMATQVAFAMSNLRDLAEEMVVERKRVVALNPSDDRGMAYDRGLELLAETRADLAFFRSAQREFLPQLLRLRSVSPREAPLVDEVEEAVDRTLALGAVAVSPSSRIGNFRDVPADHWAAKAVGDLRALGLLDGYPDGRFRG